MTQTAEITDRAVAAGELKFARKLVLFMAQGIQSSADNARRAQLAVQAAGDADESLDLSDARDVIDAIRIGVGPSQERCVAAAGQIEAAIAAVREGQGSVHRGSVERMR